jgi:hypothetical protein
MYKTGDISQNFERLKIELKKIKYPVENIESENFSNGNPLFFLPIIHYVILDYSKYIAKVLYDNQYELFSKSDQDFISKAFKALIDLFNFKPNVTVKQFFSLGYAEAKVILCLEVIRIIKGEHNNLVKKAYSSKPPVCKNKKVNDSFRSLKNNEVDIFIDNSSNNYDNEKKAEVEKADRNIKMNRDNKIMVVYDDRKMHDENLKGIDHDYDYEHNRRNNNYNQKPEFQNLILPANNTRRIDLHKPVHEDYKQIEKNERNHTYDIEEDFPNATSPKFNETPVKKNYNFNMKIFSSNKKERNIELDNKIIKEKIKNDMLFSENEDYLDQEQQYGRETNFNSENKATPLFVENKNNIHIAIDRRRNLNNNPGDNNHNFDSFLNYRGETQAQTQTQKILSNNKVKKGEIFSKEDKHEITNNEYVHMKNFNPKINPKINKNYTHSNRYTESEIRENYENENEKQKEKENEIHLNNFDEREKEDYIFNYKEHLQLKNKQKPNANVNANSNANEEIIEKKKNKENSNNEEFDENKIEEKITNHKEYNFPRDKHEKEFINKDIPPSLNKASSHANTNQKTYDSEIDRRLPDPARNIPANKNSFIEFSSLIEIINSLANSVKEMTSKVEEFKTNIENRVEKLEAEMTIIKNRVSILETKNSSIPHLTNSNRNLNALNVIHESTSNNLNNTNEDNEHIFSFADDHNNNLQNRLASKAERIINEEKSIKKTENMNQKNFKSDNNYNNYNSLNNNINSNYHNHLSHKPIIKESNITNNINILKQPNKIMNDIEDTDSIIQRIANRFKETQKLLNEFK